MSRGPKPFVGRHRHHGHHSHLLSHHLLGDILVGAMVAKGITSTLKYKKEENK